VCFGLHQLVLLTLCYARGSGLLLAALLLNILPVVLEKFKDKAAVVGKAAAEALDAMARYSFSLVDVAEVRSITMLEQCAQLCTAHGMRLDTSCEPCSGVAGASCVLTCGSFRGVVACEVAVHDDGMLLT
jgi:hypothetical protein